MAAPSQAPTEIRLRVAVVDDDTRSRALVVSLLRGRGHEVWDFPEAQACIAAHREQPFQLVVSDWVMPGISGLDLVRVLRQLTTEDELAILMVTGRARPRDLEAVLAAGATDYLAKPADPVTLRTRLLVIERALLERLRARKALRRKSYELRQLIEHSPDGIIAHHDGRIVYANPTFARMLGHDSPSEFFGTHVFDLVHPDHHALLEARWQRWDETGVPPSAIDVRFRRRDGDYLVVEGLPGTEIEFDGRLAKVVAMRDITERRQMQAKLLLTDRLASMGTLAAGVAHEINNPLGYVSANLDYILERIPAMAVGLTEDEREEIAAAAREARQGAERVRNIVGDLTQFTRADSDSTGAVDVNAVVRSALQMTANELRHRARVETDLTDVPLAHGNSARLGQVFVNLLINAAQALSVGGAGENRIGVRSGLDEQGRVRVEVSDSGPGIASDDLHRIFDPFFTTKPIGEGTGLGLSICHSIVTSVGGDIVVRSDPGVGTTVTVALPLAVTLPTSASAADPAMLASTAGRARILIIDDEELVGRSLRRALSKHDVVLMTDGREALEVLEEQSFDVIFCDLMMPEISGMEVYATLRERQPAVAERVVFMTGGAFTPRAKVFLESVDNPRVDKPFDVARLRALIAEYV